MSNVKDKQIKKLKLLYDGTCLVCHKEISYYKKNDINNVLDVIDISTDDFKAKDYNLNFDDVNKYFHLIDENGDVIIGVDAFIKIWKSLEGFEKWHKIGGAKILRPFLDVGYNVFVNIRPFLPKRDNCSVG